MRPDPRGIRQPTDHAESSRSLISKARFLASLGMTAATKDFRARLGLDNFSPVGKIPTTMKNEQIGCLSIHDAEERMRHCLNRGAIIPSRHFREELANEGINLQDAWIVLRHGHIYDAPEKDMKTGE